MGTRQKWFDSNRFSKTKVMDHFNQMLKKKGGGGGGELEFADVDSRALREAPVKMVRFHWRGLRICMHH